MWLRLVIVVILAAVIVACGQHKVSQSAPQATPEPPLVAANYPSLEAQAKECKEAFLRKDFSRYADLTYTRWVEATGGKERFEKNLARDMKDAEATGLKYLSFTLDAPSQIIRDSGNLYAVLPIHMTVRSRDGTFRSYDCMIGVSSDDGHNWTFFDVGAFGRNGVSVVIGEVANKLELPPEKKPVKLSE